VRTPGPDPRVTVRPPSASSGDAPAGGNATGDTVEERRPDELTTDLDDLERLEQREELDALEVDPEHAPEPDGPAPRLVVFDVGEVLVDETRVWTVWAELLGVSPLTFAAVLGAAIAQGEDHTAVFPHVAPNIDWRRFEDEHERRYGGFRTQDLYTDVQPCLAELRSLGFGVVIAGNQPARRSEQLRALELPCDDLVTSEELGVEKPDPGFFTAVLQRAGTTDPTDVIYVGDRVDNDIGPASAAGWRTCWLRRGPWGHLQDLPDGLTPDLSLEGLGELPLLLSQWRDG
jgi:HAD superfamily hydrolase (TIGR01549 family)